MKTIQVLIADDQTLIRDGLKTMLEMEDDIEVVGTAANGEIAYNLALELQPQVILMDIKMPGVDGIESARKIKKKLPETFIIMLSTFDEEENIIDALCAGASNYLLKDMPIEDIIQAIRYAVEDKILLSKPIVSKVTSQLFNLYDDAKKRKRQLIHDFSERELEIIRYMIQGFTNKKIASVLYITEGTVKNYISSIYSKIGTSDRTKAVLLLKEQGV